MTIIRQSDWLDGDNLDEAQALLLLQVLEDAANGVSLCVVCRAEQPDDVRWPAYAMEVMEKASGDNSPDIEYRACPTCEPKIDRLIFQGK